jgi:glyoxylase-like metal-dependent hydrolase (beta-lactamase superfamily II)
MSLGSPHLEDSPPIRIEGITLGPFETNSYLVYRDDPPRGERPCWIIDPSFEPQELIQRVRELRLKPAAVVLTHAHVDHIAGVDEVLDAFPGTPVWVHEAEARWLGDPRLNLGAPIGLMITCRGPDRLLHEGETLDLDGSLWRLFHTPGHSPGGITLYHEPSAQALVGDTLFAGSVGRTDFPGSDPRTLAASIRERHYALPDRTTIYPGHGPTSTIGQEKRTNPFVRG